MSDKINMRDWPEKIRQRYENYLKTLFFFSDSNLRDSFQEALQKEGSLLQGSFTVPHHEFKQGIKACVLANECLSDKSADIFSALLEGNLYAHQERAIRATCLEDSNVFVATGTASGKTESFLYPILFELYRQYLRGEMEECGVRAMILYPMNALANDQRDRLADICKKLKEAGSGFKPTFGQYTGQTPKHRKDTGRNAATREKERCPGELVFRDEMQKKPPHILLTNYSMLEYLLIRPNDSPLFDGGRGKHWQFLVLDEAHQYRGAKGIEIGMLIRRLKQRLRDGGRQAPFRCIATSATISSDKGKRDKEAVATFAKELFDEEFLSSNIIFGEFETTNSDKPPNRYHAFLRALEGTFLVHKEGKDCIALNRSKEKSENDYTSEPIEIALCRECGQHYYVGQNRDGKLQEANRDPSQSDFGVEYYLPGSGSEVLCRRCGTLSRPPLKCSCASPIVVKKCESHDKYPDQLKKCEECGYQGGGDPVQEIVHGSDGPNSVIATALHEFLPESRRKILAFADSRQEAAYFAWYIEDSYKKLRDRNFIFRSITSAPVDKEGLSINGLQSRLLRQWEKVELFDELDTKEERNRKALTSILHEALTDNKRLSLSGVGLVKWFVALPKDLDLPDILQQPPWNFNKDESRALIGYLLDEMRLKHALSLPECAATPPWEHIIPNRSQRAFVKTSPNSRRNVQQWGGPKTSIVKHFLYRLLKDSDLSENEKRLASTKLMQRIWDALVLDYEGKPILIYVKNKGAFRLDSRLLRIKPVCASEEIWECDKCATISSYNIRNICPRNRCPGMLRAPNQERLKGNHYRELYKKSSLPPRLNAKEHTAQISNEEARKRQDKFKEGNIHLLSSSTTFEVGVDLGDLDVVFLRNVPPEPFNYTQRAGRAGRKEKSPGLVLTYCRRNPHDLYHYDNPKERILEGKMHPPRLHMRNEKVILRHVAAVALSSFFKENRERFENVKNFVKDWNEPQGANDLYDFCKNNEDLKRALYRIVPDNMCDAVGLKDDSWVEKITTDKKNSRLLLAQSEVCTDYIEMEKLRKDYIEQEKDNLLGRIKRRRETIATEKTLDFLSRKAVIPKYGFPVDVVELDVRSSDNRSSSVVLQRDLSQAIAEYAPGGKVIANKLEWKSCGIKKVEGKEWQVRYYRYDNARNFEKRHETNEGKLPGEKSYLIPEFGFVSPLFEPPLEPTRRTQRLYTTRPFFCGLDPSFPEPEEENISNIKVTKAVPGMLVILCEGKNRKGFYICRSCGAHMADRAPQHETPSGLGCNGTLEPFSLGHDMDTDVVRLQLPGLYNEWEVYSVAYAILLGAADTLEVLDTDLNVTITGVKGSDEFAVVLYDNVPGGAGLVAQLDEKEVLKEVLKRARQRVSGSCGCDSSCYGCLRSYRNQFSHPHLDRKRALEFLTSIQETKNTRKTP